MSAETVLKVTELRKVTKGEVMILIYGLLAFGAFVMLVGGLLFLDALGRDREQKWKRLLRAERSPEHLCDDASALKQKSLPDA